MLESMHYMHLLIFPDLEYSLKFFLSHDLHFKIYIYTTSKIISFTFLADNLESMTELVRQHQILLVKPLKFHLEIYIYYLAWKNKYHTPGAKISTFFYP